jgi:hypothetical protein
MADGEWLLAYGKWLVEMTAHGPYAINPEPLAWQ